MKPLSKSHGMLFSGFVGIIVIFIGYKVYQQLGYKNSIFEGLTVPDKPSNSTTPLQSKENVNSLLDKVLKNTNADIDKSLDKLKSVKSLTEFTSELDKIVKFMGYQNAIEKAILHFS